jgi:coiled-coil domain-containing protein 130
VVVQGGKARDYGDLNDRVREGENDVPILTAEEREQRREDAFAQLEGKVEEKQQTQNTAKRIQELYEAGERDWEDPWNANKRMRESFRHDRKAIKRKEMADQQIKDRLGTDMALLPETEEDALRAKLVSYGEERIGAPTDVASTKPVFTTPNRTSAKSTKLNSRDTLRERLLANTRANTNPFG